MNAELVTLTYGTIVAQLCKDYDSDYVEVNKQLDKMGYNIGLRLIDDFLAKSNVGRCSSFRDTAEMISKARSRHESSERNPLTSIEGWLQDIPEHHSDYHELDQRQ